mmetsp:Transcript_8680/g.35753  ORF Transcript_8680/g.35753 Transcript_8680/m.35753 type:complete len:100 (+) Transcript_8680:2210-2509(+)
MTAGRGVDDGGPYVPGDKHGDKAASDRYFDRDGWSKWPSVLLKEGRDHVRKMPALTDYCRGDPDLFQLLSGLLAADPAHRLSATEALQSCAMLDPARLV